MQRRPIIIANWKMNRTVSETIRSITELKSALSGKQEVDIVIAPPFSALHPAEIASQGTVIQLAAQNMYFEESGAYTGEVSAAMLVDVGCDYVILGHSERRKYFDETDADINRKVKAALASELKPVLCVGETKEQRDNKKTFEVIELQLTTGLRGISEADADQVVVAYEPVWAIGTGEPATPGMAQEVHQFIREKIGVLFRRDTGQNVRVIYGGSVNVENIKDLMKQDDIDGALIGGASLNTADFIKMIHFGEA